MAPPPEYDKEPKAPDKSATNISTEDSKLLHNLVNDQHTNSDHKPAHTVTAVEVENKKHVETLDDGQLKALLDEAINYKNPKDREGKSKIFKELLEEVEQESDEQASSAARALGGWRGGRRARRGAALAQSNSLQDLVAALAAEPPRRARHAPHHPPAQVSARAHHGGSLPSGVDTSSLSEEPARGAGYLATVRCVNPPPLAERRVSASDANTPAEMELLNRRSKPMFPMTYTARATLEIGSGAVCSGRAVTTTTASNQVRTPASARQVPSDPQSKLMNALCPRQEAPHRGGGHTLPLRHCRDGTQSATSGDLTGKTNIPRGPMQPDSWPDNQEDTETSCRSKETELKPRKGKGYLQKCNQSWVENVDNWYKSLPNYTEPLKIIYNESLKNKNKNPNEFNKIHKEDIKSKTLENTPVIVSSTETLSSEDLRRKTKVSFSPKHSKNQKESVLNLKSSEKQKDDTSPVTDYSKYELNISESKRVKKYDLVVPTLSDINPKNVRPMSIGQPQQPLRRNENNNTAELAENNIQEVINPVDINSNTVEVEVKQTEDVDNSSDGDLNDNRSSQCTECCGCDVSKKREQLNELIDMFNRLSAYADADRDIELKELKSIEQQDKNRSESFSKYVALQQNLIFEIASLQSEISHQHTISKSSSEFDNNLNQISVDAPSSKINTANDKNKESTDSKQLSSISEESEIVNEVCSAEEQKNKVISESDCTANISNNAYILLTIPSSNNTESFVSETPSKPKTGKKKENLALAPSHTNKKDDALNKNILKVLLFENLFKNNNNEKSGIPGVSSITNNEVDSAISFSCITTPEVVASCNTTSSTSQSAVAVDPKKTTDENGNSVQGFSSPLSGSSQHKKPRRKKTSKNETVIDCQLMDGYQGDKDVNELLRFIESNADSARAAKLPRAKHKDDDDKKKRSAERRKDKDKLPRASSLDELSRTRLDELTRAAPPDLAAAAKPERRSWGDDARDALEPPAAELTDFQTVTKKRKPRRRADEPERDPPRRARPPSPRRRESAPPSERSNDSNDDLDSVHSLPDARAPPPAPHASYADIARTRHNIPDLIESCNFYAEGDAAPRRDAPGDPDYPALRRRGARPARARKLRPARAPDVLAHRPAVLLRAPPAPGMDGVTFGFELNQQLLAPAPAPLLQLVHYVAAAWDDALRHGAKARYFSE